MFLENQILTLNIELWYLDLNSAQENFDLYTQKYQMPNFQDNVNN